MSDRDALRQGLLALARPAPQPVTLPDGSVVWVRTMTAFDSHHAQHRMDQHKAEGDGCDTGRVLAMLLSDAQGNLLFDVAVGADVQLLSQLPPAASRAIFAVHNRINAATDAEATALGNG